MPVYKGSPAPKPLAEQKRAAATGGDQRKLGLVLLLIALGAALAVYYLTGAA